MKKRQRYEIGVLLLLLCHNSIAQGYLSTEQNEEFDEINADVRKTTDCEVDEQDTLGGSQTKKVYIAGSDDKLYKFINELVQNKVKNELTVYFYFYKHKKFSYISSFPTSFDSLKSVLCKYAHYFYENKTADINSIEQFVDNLIVLSRTKGKRFVGASRNKDHPINISDEDDYRIYTKNKGYYEFDVPETQHYKGKDINVETVNVGNYNDFDSKLDTEDLDSQHTNKQNDIFPTVHKNIIDDTEVIQNDKTRLNIKNSNSDAMNTGIYEFDITGGEKYKQKDIIFDTNYISGGMDGDKYNDNNDYDVITNKNNDAYEFNVPNSKNYKGNNIIVDIVEPESYLDKQGEENIVTGYKIPPTTYGMSDVNNRAGIDSLPTQLYDTGGLGKTDKEYEFNAPCSNYKQKDINVDIFKSNLNNNEILSNQNTGYNEFDVQSPSYKGKDINVDILNGFPRQEDNFRNKLVEPVRHLYKDAHISSYFKGDATNRGYALDTNLNELSSLINKNSPQSESDGTLIEYPATSTKQELTLSNGNAIDNEPLQTEIGSYAPYSAQVNVPHENTYPIREDYDGSTLKNELRDGMDTNIKEFIPYYSSSDVLDTEKPTLVNKNTVTNKGEYTMQDLPCHTHLGEQPNDHTHRTVYWPKGHFHLTYHLDEPYSTICEKSDTMDNTDLKIPCSNYYIPDSYSFRKNKLNSIPYLGGKTYGYNEYSIKNPPWPNNIDINLAHMNQRKQALSDLKTQPLRTSESFVGNLRDRFESDLPEIDKHRYSFRGPSYSNNYLSDYKGNYGRKPFRLQSQPCSKNYNHQVMKAKHDLNDLHQGQAYYSQYEGIYDNNSQQKNMFRNLHKSSYGGDYQKQYQSQINNLDSIPLEEKPVSNSLYPHIHHHHQNNLYKPCMHIYHPTSLYQSNSQNRNHQSNLYKPTIDKNTKYAYYNNYYHPSLYVSQQPCRNIWNKYASYNSYVPNGSFKNFYEKSHLQNDFSKDLRHENPSVQINNEKYVSNPFTMYNNYENGYRNSKQYYTSDILPRIQSVSNQQTFNLLAANKNLNNPYDNGHKYVISTNKINKPSISKSICPCSFTEDQTEKSISYAVNKRPTYTESNYIFSQGSVATIKPKSSIKEHKQIDANTNYIPQIWTGQTDKSTKKELNANYLSLAYKTPYALENKFEHKKPCPSIQYSQNNPSRYRINPYVNERNVLLKPDTKSSYTKASYSVMSDKTNMYKPKNPFHVCNKIPCQRNVQTVPICTAKNIIATPNSYIPVSKPSSLQIPDSTFDKLKYPLYPTQMTYDQSYSTNTQDLYKSHIHSPIPRSSLKSYITSYQSDKSKIPIQQSNRYHSNYFDTYEVPRIWGLQKMLPNSFNHQLYSGYSNDFGKNQMYLPTINVSNNIKSKQTQSYDQIPNSLNISPYMSDADQKSHLPCYNEILADFQSNSPSIEYQQNPLYELHNYIGKPCHAIMGNLPYKVQANSFQGWKATVLSQQPCHNYLPSFTQKLPRFSSPSNYHNTNLPQQTNTPCFRSYEPCVQLERPQSETERGVSQKNAYSYNTPLKVRQNLPYSTYTKPFMVNSKICTPNFNPAITDIIPQKDNTFINQPLITTPVRYDTDIPKSICPLAKVNMQNKLALWNRNDISRSIFADDFICKDKLRESYGSFTPFFPPYALNPIQWHESKKDIKSNVVADNLDNTFTSMYVPSSLSYPQSYSNNIAYNPYIYSPNPSLQEISYQNRKSTLFKPTVDVTRPENISPLTSLSSHFITEPKLSTSPMMVAKPSIPCPYSQNTIADAQLEEPCNYNIKKPRYTTTSYNIILNKDIRSETLKQQNANKFHQSSRKPIKNLYTLINSKPGQFASFKTSHPNLPCDNYLSQFEPLVYKYGQGMLPIRNRQDYLPFKYNSEKEKSSFYKPGVTYNTRINQIAGTKICPFSGLGENIPYSPSFQNVIGTIDVDNEPQSSTYFGPSSGHHLNQHPCYEQAYSVKPYKPFYNRNPYIQDSFDLTGKPTMSLYPQPALIDSTIPSVSKNYLRKTCQNSINLSRFDYLSNGLKIFTDPKQVSKYSAHYPSIDNYLNPFSLNSKSTYNSLQESYLPSNYYDVNFPNTDNDNNYLNSYLALGTNKPCIHIMSNKPGLYNKQVNEDTFNPSICDYSSAKYKENIPKLTINNIKEIFKSKLNNAIPTALPTKYFDDNFNDPNVHAQDTIKIDLGDIAVAKYDDKNRYMIKTDNPKIDLIVWKSKVKTLNAKLIINVKDMPVVNFMPVVRDMSIDDGYNIAKDYVKRFFGEPMIVNGRYTAYDPYAVVLNSKNSYVLWPAICNCGCKVCGCKCGQ